jgi:hypothetical protein
MGDCPAIFYESLFHIFVINVLCQRSTPKCLFILIGTSEVKQIGGQGFGVGVSVGFGVSVGVGDGVGVGFRVT